MIVGKAGCRVQLSSRLAWLATQLEPYFEHAAFHHDEHDSQRRGHEPVSAASQMASVTTKTPDATKPARRTTRSSIRHSLNLASVGKALADVINKEGKDSERRKSTVGTRSKDVPGRRASTIGFTKGGGVLEPVLEGQSRNITPHDLKTVTQPRRSSSSLQRAGRLSVDETGSKVTTTTSPQSTTLNHATTTLRPRKTGPGSALPKYRPKSVIVEGLPRRSLSPIYAGTRRKHSSSEEDRDSSSLGTTCAHVVHSPMDKMSRPISPIPRRSSRITPTISSRTGNDKPSPSRKEKIARNSPATSTPPRPRKTQKPSSSPVVKKTGLPRPSPRDGSPASSSDSPQTPTSAKNVASRYLNVRSTGRESPSPLRGSSVLNGSTSSRRNIVKGFVDSESDSSQNTPTAAIVTKSSGGYSEGPGNDSVDDVEFMLAEIASPSAPTPGIPRIQTTFQGSQPPETPSRPSLHPQKSMLGLSLAPKNDTLPLPSPRKSSPDRRPAAERNSIAAWEKLADLSVEINAAELGGGLITELDLPSTPGMLSPSPSIMRLDSEQGGRESPTPLTLPSPGGYASISQVLLPAVTPSPAPAMHSLHSNDFFGDDQRMDSGTVTLLRLQLASVENLAKERLARITRLEEQMHALKEIRNREEHELASHAAELEERLNEALASREHDQEDTIRFGPVPSAEEATEAHAACRDMLEDYVQQAEDSRREAVSAAIAEFSERERAERAQLLLQVEKRQQLSIVVRDAGKQWQNVHDVADGELEAIRTNRETLAVLRAGLDFFEAQIYISRCIRIPPPTAARFHLT